MEYVLGSWVYQVEIINGKKLPYLIFSLNAKEKNAFEMSSAEVVCCKQLPNIVNE